MLCERRETDVQSTTQTSQKKKNPTKGKESKPDVSALTSKKGLARIAHFSKFLMHSIHVTM